MGRWKPRSIWLSEMSMLMKTLRRLVDSRVTLKGSYVLLSRLLFLLSTFVEQKFLLDKGFINDVDGT